jgi:MoxR-like ATPase
MIMEWADLASVLGAQMHTLLYGPPGTGKTHIAADYDAYVLTLTAETPAAELRGHYIPEGTRFVWHDGPAIRAWREGRRLVLNEIREASGDALTFLYAVLDDPTTAKLTLPTGETVRPRSGFHCIATTNASDIADLAASLPPALFDRFAIRVYVDQPHPNALARLPEKLAALVASTIEADDDRRVSLRQALAYTALTSQLQNAKLAAQAVFGSRSIDVFNSLVLAIAADKVSK